MDPPEKPSEDDCCNSGCNPCILDVYELKLRQYQKYLRNQAINKISVKRNLISEIQFRKFTVIETEAINGSHIMITFKYNANKIISDESLYYRPGQYLLLRVKDEKLHQYTRAYTPLPLNEGTQEEQCDTFKIIVKLYKDGIVSKYLHNLRIGNVTEWRGPYGTFQYEPNTYNKICMIAQGTAITTLYSIIKSIVENEDDMTFVSLLYCCKEISDILFRYELLEMKQYWNFKYEIFLSTPSHDTTTNIEYDEPIVCDKLDFKVVKCSVDPTDSNSAVFVCGSDTFMKCFKDKLTNEINLLDENLYCFA